MVLDETPRACLKVVVEGDCIVLIQKNDQLAQRLQVLHQLPRLCADGVPNCVQLATEVLSKRASRLDHGRRAAAHRPLAC
jgi:hypothetical protein